MTRMNYDEGDRPAAYEIQVVGQVDPRWSDWFDGMTFSSTTGDSPVTTMTGLVADQAALRGLLTKIWNLNLTVISVLRMPAAGQQNS